MGLEAATYISGLNSGNPTSSDNASQGDDHIRLIKSTLLSTFPNVTGAVTSTHTELNILDGVTSSAAELNILDGVTATAAELNILDGVTATASELNHVSGVTSAIQTQLDAKLPKAGGTMTGDLSIINSTNEMHITLGSNGAYFYGSSISYGIYKAGGGHLTWNASTGDLSTTGSFTASGLIKGNGGGSGLGSITVSTSAPSGGTDGDLWLRYE